MVSIQTRAMMSCLLIYQKRCEDQIIDDLTMTKCFYVFKLFYTRKFLCSRMYITLQIVYQL